MSAPQVTNLAAKMLAVNPNLTPPEVDPDHSGHRHDKTADGRRVLVNPKKAHRNGRGEKSGVSAEKAVTSCRGNRRHAGRVRAARNATGRLRRVRRRSRVRPPAVARPTPCSELRQRARVPSSNTSSAERQRIVDAQRFVAQIGDARLPARLPAYDGARHRAIAGDGGQRRRLDVEAPPSPRNTPRPSAQASGRATAMSFGACSCCHAAHFRDQDDARRPR